MNGRGLTNGRGSVNGRDLVGGKRQKRGAVTGRKTESALAESAGFLDAKGLTNGKGMVNGAGLTNGKGLVNGRRLIYTEAQKERRRGFAKRTSAVLAVLLAVLVVILPALYSSLVSPAPVTIDGAFEDWADWEKQARFDDSPSDMPENANINLVAFMARASDRDLFVYVAMQANGHPFTGPAGQGAESIRILIDKDYNIDTGFCAWGLGADYMIEIQGHGGQVRTSSLKIYPASTGGCDSHSDANAWQAAGGARAAAGGSKVEVAVRLSDLGSMRATDLPYLLVVAQDSLGRTDVGDVIFSSLPGALIMSQTPFFPDRGAISTGGAPLLMTIQARAVHVNLTLFSFLLTVDSPNGGCLQVTNVKVTNGWVNRQEQGGSGGCFGNGQTITIRMNTQQAQFFNWTDPPTQIDIQGHSGGSAQVSIVRAYVRGPRDVATSPPSNTYSGHGSILPPVGFTYSYVDSVPGVVRIDGSFGDWPAGPTDAAGDVSHSGPDSFSNPNVDLRSVNAYVTRGNAGTASFYLEVAGSLWAASQLAYPTPPRPQEPSSGGGGGSTAVEDLGTIYIDSDFNASTGWQRFPGFGVDAVIDVKGAGGGYGRLAHITGSTLTRWDPAAQNFATRNSGFGVGYDSSKLETQVSALDLCDGPCVQIRYVFHMSDSSGHADETDVSTTLSRGGGDHLVATEGPSAVHTTFQGDVDVPVLFATVSAPPSNVEWSSISALGIRFLGVGPTDITGVRVYMDRGTVGTFDSEDLTEPALGQSTMSDQGLAVMALSSTLRLGPGDQIHVFVTVDISAKATVDALFNGSLGAARGVYATGVPDVLYSYPAEPDSIRIFDYLPPEYRAAANLKLNEIIFTTDEVEIKDTSSDTGVSLTNPQISVEYFGVDDVPQIVDRQIKDYSGSTSSDGFAVVTLDNAIDFSTDTTSYTIRLKCATCGTGGTNKTLDTISVPSSSSTGAYGRYSPDGTGQWRETDDNTSNDFNTIPEFQDAAVPALGLAILVVARGWRRPSADRVPSPDLA